MIFTIENKHLVVAVETAGAELKSLYHKARGQEFIWQGDPQWWPRRAPVLFPIVGKLNNNEYRIGDKTFSLPQHGFARDNVFEMANQSVQALSFVLRSSEALSSKYPFQFELTIIYTLLENTLRVEYKVANKDRERMYFSIGAHPGFALQPGEALNDYYIEFNQRETLDRYLLDEGLFNGKTERVISGTSTLALSDDQMKKDAIVFKNMQSNSVKLKSRRSDYFLKFEFQGFPYFGVWSKPGASFVCLEPWCGVADHKGFRGELRDKEGIQFLEPGRIFERSFLVGL